MSKVPSLILAMLFCLMPLIMVGADPNVPGDDLIETSFSGTVIDSSTKAPVARAFVYGHDEDFQMMRSTMTDENGTYYLEFKDGGHYTLYVDHKDYEPATKDATVDINTNTVIDFALVPKVYDTSIFGVVTDSRTGASISDVYISLWEITDPGNNQGYSWVSDYRTEEDGKYSFEVYEGTFVISADKEGYDQFQSDIIELKSGEAFELNIDMSPWARGVTGTVYDENGDPFPGVSVSLETTNRRSYGSSTVTDENGEYEILVPRGGEFTLKAFMDGYRPYDQEIIIPEDTMVEQDIEMTKALLPDPLLRILYLILTILGLM